MPDDAFRRAPPSPNVDDRRKEFGELTQLLMGQGVPPPASANPDSDRREALGLGPGQWLLDDLPVAEFSPLGVDAGLPELIQQAYQQKLQRQQALMEANPWPRKTEPR